MKLLHSGRYVETFELAPTEPALVKALTQYMPTKIFIKPDGSIGSDGNDAPSVVIECVGPGEDIVVQMSLETMIPMIRRLLEMRAGKT